jgi:hypothetical protein
VGEAGCLQSWEKSFSRSEVYSFRVTAVQGQERTGACCGCLPLTAGRAVAEKEEYTATPGNYGEKDEWIEEECMPETRLYSRSKCKLVDH